MWMKDQTDQTQLSFSPLPLPLPLRAGSGTVQLVTGWEKICSASRRPRSPVTTREPPLSPLPIGVFLQVPCNSPSDQDTSRVFFFFSPTGAAFKKKMSDLISPKVRAGLRQQPGVRAFWRFVLDRPAQPGQRQLLPMAHWG